MINDPYAQIRKKLAMAQVEPQEGVVRGVNNEPQIQPQVAEPEIVQEEPIPEPMIEQFPQDRDLTGAIGDMAVAAGPALQNLLFGGSYAEQSGRNAQANKYLQNRGVAHAAEIKDLKSVVGTDGKPEYLRASLAEGREPYYEKKAAALGANSGNLHALKGVYNKDTGERGYQYFFKNGTTKIVNSTGQESTGGNWEDDKGIAVTKMKDQYGTESVEQWDKNSPAKKGTVTSRPGFGKSQGVPTEGLKQIEKSVDEHDKRVVDLETKRGDLQSSLAIFEKKGATPGELTAARESIIRAISTEPRLTDEDVKRAMGNDFRSIWSQAGNSISNKGFGEMSEKQKGEFLATARTLISRLNSGINRSKSKLREHSSNIENSGSYLDKKLGPDSKNEDEKIKKELSEIESRAAKKWGKGSDLYNGFMKKKKTEMGIYE